jgi:hypothetical protein
MATRTPRKNEQPFAKFLAAFPRHRTLSVDADALRAEVLAVFGVKPPSQLVEFWRLIGCGAFADGEFYLFGTGERGEWRDSLVAWNNKPFWRDWFAPPNKRGPLFFAETCFGYQLGFHYEKRRCVPTLFAISTMETYILADDFGKLFDQVLTERFAVIEPDHLNAARQGAGQLPKGKWYCPALSPLLGGSGAPGNWLVMSPSAYVKCAFAEHEVSSLLGGGPKV